MIRIRKPAVAPDILRERGKQEATNHKRLYTRYKADYDSGQKTFEVKSSIYGDGAVKSALTAAQHDKCCFCEAKITHISFGDVEHFRPKKGFRQRPESPLGRPGYYWLAYDWKNLFLSCQLCNQRHKGNLFPLQNPQERARSHHDDIGREEPLFIHPEDADPEQYISFRQEYPYPIDDNNKGKVTIKSLGLEREALAERRRDYLKQLKLIRILARSEEPEAEDARAFLQHAASDIAEYAAMARAFLSSLA